MSSLTVLILIPNAGDRLERCLKSAQWADDLFCVVDPNTTDGSDEVARRYSSHVVTHEYVNKADQCNWALPQIDTEWTLVLDADEWLSPELTARIKGILADPAACDGYRVRRLSYFFGRLILHCGWDHDYNVRLFRTKKGRYHVQRVHATVDIDGAMGRIDEVMYHDDKRNFEEYFRTFMRFTTWSAQDLHEMGRRAKWSDLTLRPLARFVKMYAIGRGFLDGYHGIVLCGLAAFSVFTKYAKLWHITRLAGGASEKPPET
ncbi:MAG: glycosyltransferase family 2 protein [Candidatus Hydrogenedentes bacterium]|nr:glycosyltransferase family 2 protein [Candidatus Hydrogenedentota bacterium]